MSIAEEIARNLDAESSRWIGERHAGAKAAQDGRTRYVFADGSAIVVAGVCWDVEGSTPFSWLGE